jgi:hypothetical protein
VRVVFCFVRWTDATSFVRFEGEGHWGWECECFEREWDGDNDSAGESAGEIADCESQIRKIGSANSFVRFEGEGDWGWESECFERECDGDFESAGESAGEIADWIRKIVSEVSCCESQIRKIGSTTSFVRVEGEGDSGWESECFERECDGDVESAGESAGEIAGSEVSCELFLTFAASPVYSSFADQTPPHFSASKGGGWEAQSDGEIAG